MLPVCLLSAVLPLVINGKTIDDEAIYNFWRFLVEDFFLPVIKPPGAYFNNKLLPSCRSSKFIFSFPATSVLLSAPLDPIRPDRNSKSAWRQSVLIFLKQALHWKLRRAATSLIKWFSSPIPFLSLSRAQIPPSPSPFNACHPGYSSHDSPINDLFPRYLRSCAFEWWGSTWVWKKWQLMKFACSLEVKRLKGSVSAQRSTWQGAKHLKIKRCVSIFWSFWNLNKIGFLMVVLLS